MMVIKKDLISLFIKVLKKYGFYSLNRAPYLYQSNDTYGIYFIWPTKHYGTLERILFFEQEHALEEEVFKYWWFLNHKNKLDITVVFDNYETLSPKVTYRMDQIVLTEQVMKEFKNEEDIRIT